LSERSFIFSRERVLKLTKDTAVVAVSGGKHNYILIEVDRRCCYIESVIREIPVLIGKNGAVNNFLRDRCDNWLGVTYNADTGPNTKKRNQRLPLTAYS